jgi:hypothetical protein
MQIYVKGYRTRGCSMVDHFSPQSKNHNVFIPTSLNTTLLIQEIEKSYDLI